MTSTVSHCLVLASSNEPFLLANLFVLSQTPPSQLTVFFCRDDKVWPTDLLLKCEWAYKYFCFLHRGYGQAFFKNMDVRLVDNRDLEEQQALLSDCNHLVITPESYNTAITNDIEIVLSDAQIAALTQLEAYGLVINEAFLQQVIPVINQVESMTYPIAAQKVEHFIQKWLTLADVAAEQYWQESFGEEYRFLQDLELWRYGLVREGRTLLNQLIARLEQNPTDWLSHLALMLYKRQHHSLNAVAIPEFWQPIFTYYQQRLGKCLQILPYLNDFTVTVLILTYNRFAMFKRSVENIVQQPHSHWRLLIMDHGSTDETPQYCQQLALHPHIRIIRKDINEGPDAALGCWQEMLKEVNTELVMILPDDDWLLPHYLGMAIGVYQRYPWLGLVNGSYYCGPDSQIEFQYGPHYAIDTIGEPMLEMQRLAVIAGCVQGSLYRKSLLLELAPLDTISFKNTGDHAVWDYILDVKLICNYEVGYVAQPGIFITLASDSSYTGAQPEVNIHILQCVEHLYRDYVAFWGHHTMPRLYFEKYEKPRLMGYLMTQFQRMLSAASVDDLAEQIAIKEKSWIKFVELCQYIESECLSDSAPVEVNLANPYHLFLCPPHQSLPIHHPSYP